MAAFDWHDFLEQARSLLAGAKNSQTQEADYRTTVSRCYYAAFGYAYQYACDYLGFIPRVRPEDKSQDHGRLRAHLLMKRRHAVSARLKQLREWRNDCDYVRDLTGQNLSQRTADAIDAAEYVFRALPKPKVP